jgi:hypothetical protein
VDDENEVQVGQGEMSGFRVVGTTHFGGEAFGRYLAKMPLTG